MKKLQDRRGAEYKQLEAFWRQKLREHGFVDIEDLRGNLKQHNRRTIGFENREIISDFFRRLDHYLTNHPEIPRLHRLILSMWSEGARVGEICTKSKRCNSSVRTIIRHYRLLLLAMH